MSAAVKSVKSLKFWVGLALSIFLAGFTTFMFLYSHFASAEDFDKLQGKTDSMAQKLDDHIIDESARFGAFDERSKNIEEDYHWSREQLQNIADRVGATKVPVPQHVEQK